MTKAQKFLFRLGWRTGYVVSYTAALVRYGIPAYLSGFFGELWRQKWRVAEIAFLFYLIYYITALQAGICK